MILDILMPTLMFTTIAAGFIAMFCIGTKLVELCVDYWEQKTGRSLHSILRPWEKPE